MTLARAMFAAALLSLALPAMAIYKCETNGSVSYGDAACPGGQVIDTVAPASEAASARQQLARQKSELRRLENDRHRREAKEEKEQERFARAYASHKKKCDALARRVTWAKEDATAARGRAYDKAKRRAHRLTEQYDGDCAR